jgi:hypothetical protein
MKLSVGVGRRADMERLVFLALVGWHAGACSKDSAKAPVPAPAPKPALASPPALPAHYAKLFDAGRSWRYHVKSGENTEPRVDEIVSCRVTNVGQQGELRISTITCDAVPDDTAIGGVYVASSRGLWRASYGGDSPETSIAQLVQGPPDLDARPSGAPTAIGYCIDQERPGGGVSEGMCLSDLGITEYTFSPVGDGDALMGSDNVYELIP